MVIHKSILKKSWLLLSISIVLQQSNIGNDKESLPYGGKCWTAANSKCSALSASPPHLLQLASYNNPMVVRCFFYSPCPVSSAIIDRNLQTRNSISEPDLTTAGNKLRISGFPPGTTVDELWHYRRKRRPDISWIRDSLKPEEGSFKQIKSEYKRRFRDYHAVGASSEELPIIKQDISPVRGPRPDDSLILEGSHELHSEYNESFIEYPIESQTKLRKPRHSFNLIDSTATDNIQDLQDSTRSGLPVETEYYSQYIQYPILEKRHLYRRPTTLKLDGELYATTENADKFIQYLLYRRPDLVRKRTILKLEGVMDTKTEMQEKYTKLEYQQRPPLCKKFTNLHLEGELNIMTEKQEQFIPYNIQERLPLTRRHSNLHLEGDLEFLPEYTKEFIEYKSLERPKLTLPVNNLKTDGFYDVNTNVSKPFQEQIHPQIPFLRGGYTDYGVPLRLTTSKSETNLKQLGIESESEHPIEKLERKRGHTNLLLEGRIDMNPEYRNAYIDYYKTGRGTPPKVRSRRASRVDHLKSEGSMDIHPEYSCSYINFPRERPCVRKPECCLSSEGEWDHITESHQKYIPHQNVTRTEKLKREPELKLEGRFECQPEYRKAYIDYLIRERVERKSRPIDNLGKEETMVFDTVTSNGTTSSDGKPPLGISKKSTSIKPKDTLPVPSATTSRRQSPVQIQPPSSASTSSVPSSPKSSSITRNRNLRSPLNRSLSQIESSVFGPKLAVPSPKIGSRSSSPVQGIKSSRRVNRYGNIGSRSVSPASSSVCHSSTDSEAAQRRRNKRFDSPVRVENLACRSTAVSPVPPNISSTRKKWMKDDSMESNSAFVVLDNERHGRYNDNSDDNNNNKNANRSAFSDNVIYKDQKYKPSWYSAQ